MSDFGGWSCQFAIGVGNDLEALLNLYLPVSAF
jgi:hypothetical protein